jgi:hypothetical protein
LPLPGGQDSKLFISPFSSVCGQKLVLFGNLRAQISPACFLLVLLQGSLCCPYSFRSHG